MKLQFSRQIFRKILKYKTSRKIRVVRAEFYHVNWQKNRRTDSTKLTVAFRNFAKWLKPTLTRKNIRKFVITLCLHFSRLQACVFSNQTP